MSSIKEFFSPIDIKHHIDANKEKKKNLPSLSILMSNGVIKSATAGNVASSGPNFEHVRIIFSRKENGGLNSP